MCSCQLPVASLPPVSVVCLRGQRSGQLAHMKKGGWGNPYQPYSPFFKKQLLRVGYKPSSSLAVGWDHSECIFQTWIKLNPYFVFNVSCWWFTVTNLPAIWETWIPGSGRSAGEGKGNPLQYSCLGNPMREEPGGLQSMVLQRVGHDLATKQQSWSQSNLQVSSSSIGKKLLLMFGE